MAKKPSWQKVPSACPQCKARLTRKVKSLRGHFRLVHGREPTHGEKIQFQNFRNSGAPYSGKDFVKPRPEVQGGGCSPK